MSALKNRQCQKRSFLSLRGVLPKSLKNLLPQNLGRTPFDFVTFLAVARRPDIRAQRSIGESGLQADLGCGAASGQFAVIFQTRTAHSCRWPMGQDAAVAARIADIRRACKTLCRSNSHNAGRSCRWTEFGQRPFFRNSATGSSVQIWTSIPAFGG